MLARTHPQLILPFVSLDALSFHQYIMQISITARSIIICQYFLVNAGCQCQSMDTNRHNSHKLPCIPNRLVFGVALGLRIDSRIEVFTHTWFASAILNLKRKNNLRNLALCSYQCSLILRPCGGEGDRYGTSCKETSFLVIFALLLFSF